MSVLISIKACEAKQVCVRVYDLGDENDGSGLRSRLWWSLRGDSAPPFLYIEKCVAVPTQGTTQVSFAVQNDTVLSQQTIITGNPTTQGTITQCCATENDGIHVNPCYFPSVGSVSRVAKFYYKLDAGAWTYGGYINATRTS